MLYYLLSFVAFAFATRLFLSFLAQHGYLGSFGEVVNSLLKPEQSSGPSAAYKPRTSSLGQGDVLNLAERYWQGDPECCNHNSVSPKTSPHCDLQMIGDGLAFILTFANVTAIDTDDGVVLIDCGHNTFGPVIKKRIRAFSNKPVHTCIYTHGHTDHVMGIMCFEEVDRVQVVGHENVTRRFDRYRLMNGYNTYINNKQFSSNSQWPMEYKYPTKTYQTKMTLFVGKERLELFHAKGETDDATWVWLPDRKAICTGDFFIWATPNCGNPQKAQRYPVEWAKTLRDMMDLHAEILLPGHGPPIVGAERVRQALSDTAEFLEIICRQTLDAINRGHRLAQIVQAVKLPEQLMQKPYLQPVYDDPRFIVHNLWRLYAGWWDQDPAHLRLNDEKEIAAEVCSLAGSPWRLAERAEALAHEGKMGLAVQYIEWAVRADEDDLEIHRIRAAIYAQKMNEEKSLMAQGAFRAARMESEKKLNSSYWRRARIEDITSRTVVRAGLIYEGAVTRKIVVKFFQKLSSAIRRILSLLLIWPLLVRLSAAFDSIPRVRVSIIPAQYYQEKPYHYSDSQFEQKKHAMAAAAGKY